MRTSWSATEHSSSPLFTDDNRIVQRHAPWRGPQSRSGCVIELRLCPVASRSGRKDQPAEQTYGEFVVGLSLFDRRCLRRLFQRSGGVVGLVLGGIDAHRFLAPFDHIPVDVHLAYAVHGREVEHRIEQDALEN